MKEIEAEKIQWFKNRHVGYLCKQTGNNIMTKRLEISVSKNFIHSSQYPIIPEIVAGSFDLLSEQEAIDTINNWEDEVLKRILLN